ncbi:MAG: Stk1 family PASTA domain-containing Ser/Thr kinase [Lachnospiraceae bacterium]|nr:Stk1 family PASTA domain-containing Ser/Thr kinase [Lachnospiraceae bacterium]
MIQIGTILGGRYEILEHIGSGGMADVYKARCHKLNRYVAIKVLRSEYNDDDALVHRFTKEAQSTAGLNHPNIVNIYDAGYELGIHYIVMELAEGMTLKRYIRRYGRLSARETVDFSIQIASGIQAAHEHHIIHRDIKPQNILVSDSGKIKVTDFGIAKAATGDTIASSTMGSVRYLSPEQARGGYSDERSDIYSLGITMYEMATGKVPFDGENTVAIALMHIKDEITPPRCYFPDIPLSLEKIILKCTMKHPEERYQNAEDLIEDLKKVFSCPDGNYVYMDPLVDDSPTRARTREEIEEIKKSLSDSDDDNSVSKVKTAEKQTEEESNIEEDYDDDESVNPKMEKMIKGITILFGILLGCLIIYLVGSSMHLFHFKNNKATTESSVTETTTEAVSTEEVKYVKISNLLGLTRKEAEAKMEDLSLKAVFEYEDDVDHNDSTLIVVKQQYEKGESVPEGTEVTLTLGVDENATTENDRIEVPALINYQEDQAVEVLTQLGLKVKKIYTNSDTVEAGYVMKQSPKGGSIVDKGFTITITVSRGVSQVIVPSLSGMTQEVAERELNRVGLKLGQVTSDYSGLVGVGEVVKQGIPSGTSVDKGTEVSIVISLGEQETYHYESSVSITDSPFENEEDTGKVELILEQNGSSKTIYSNNKASSGSFPLNVDFESKSEEDATVILYLDGTEVDRYDVEWNAVAD